MKLNRRKFLKSLGLSTVSLSIIPGIDRTPLRKLYPMLVPAEEIIPGFPYWYTSTCRECPAGCGVLLKVREGNVIKIEGNPAHPVNKGGLCIRGQAALQELYHVKRLREPNYKAPESKRQPISWEEAFLKIKAAIDRGRTAILTGKLNGSRKKYVSQWVKKVRNASHIEFEPVVRADDVKANQIIFNKSANTEYHLDRADFILSIGADFLETFGSTVKLTRQFGEARTNKNGKSAKFIYIGLVETLTAANADEFLAISPFSETELILALVNWILKNDKVTVPQSSLLSNLVSQFTLENASAKSGIPLKKLEEIGKALISAQAPIVICGDSVAANDAATDAHVATNLLNYVLGSYKKTVSFANLNPGEPIWTIRDFDEFIQSMENGQISTLIVYGADPLFSYPNPERLKKAIENVPQKIALLTTPNEIGELADFQLPVHHAIETWGIDEPESGIFSLVQAAMEPVFNSKSFEEILFSIAPATRGLATPEEFLKQEWNKIFRQNGLSGSLENNWNDLALNGGIWKERQPSFSTPQLSNSAIQYLRRMAKTRDTESLTVLVKNSYHFYDGRGANKTWLWEIPHSLHHTVWDSPVMIHPELAKKKNIREGDIVSISVDGRSIEAPALIWERMSPNVIAMEVGAGVDVDGNHSVKSTGNPLQLLAGKIEPISGDLVKMVSNVEIKPTGKWRKLVRLQGSYDQGERDIYQAIFLGDNLASHDEHKEKHHQVQIYPEHKHADYDWAMVIDLSACVGCGACAAACYAENNVPVVGKHQCERGREMAWLRVERFELENGRSGFLPMMCQQCEAAPCETVCPVYATVHSEEGLNLQVYNRCVGTRYCSNNCPYKVRRFNYFPPQWPEPMDKMLNPDIYHRPKGVMEKCNFCYQRIRLAKENAKIEGRDVVDGEIVPACAQSCPTNAIVFGNLNDPNSRVSQLIKDPRAYVVFEELNTKPSVIYLKGIKHA